MHQLKQRLEALKQPGLQAAQYGYSGPLNYLFVEPELSGASFYKIVLPYYMLSSMTDMGAALTGWHPYHPIKRFQEREPVPLNSYHILWADTLILPFTLQDLTGFMEAVRTINQATRIVYHVDFDFTNVPHGTYLSYYVGHNQVRDVLGNILAADKVLTSSAPLASRLLTKMQEMGEEVTREKFGVQLLCMAPDVQMEGISQNQEQLKDDFFNLVVIAGDYQLHDLASSIPALRKMKEKHGERLKITLFGANKNRGIHEFKEMVGDLKFNYHGPVPIWSYFATLSSMAPDLVLIPCDFSDFSVVSMDYKRYLDAAMLGCPVAAPAIQVFQTIIKNGENGYLYSGLNELEPMLDQIISTPKNIKVGQQVRDYAEANFSFNHDRLQRLINVMG